MTSRRTLNMLFTLHSWAGLVTGLLLFVVCFSGAVVVFKNEVDLWANPSLKALAVPAVPAPMDVVLLNLKQAYPSGAVQFVAVPTPHMPAYMAFVQQKAGDNDSRIKVALNGETGALIGPVNSQLGQFMRSLHVFLFFGPRWIVGFLGVVMLVLIGTGFVIHRKILAELFTLRWGRSLRVVMSDLHKAAGVWGLAFHVLIAFTGAWLGLAPVFERGYDYLASSGPAMATRAAGAAGAAAPKAKPPVAPAEMVSVDTMLLATRAAVPGFEPRFVSLQRWGQAGATLRVTGSITTDLYSTARVVLDGGSGQVKEVHDPRVLGFWSQVNGLMEPLHFGDFGGVGLKWLYFLLGLTPAFLSLSGTLIWLDRRRQRRLSGAAWAADVVPHASAATLNSPASFS